MGWYGENLVIKYLNIVIVIIMQRKGNTKE